MIDRFQEILQHLSEELNLDLIPDRNHACAIQVKQGLIVQLESDAEQENLLMASQLIDVPPGKFRENVLREALKANAKPDPRIGILSYIPKINQLVLYQTYPFEILTAERLVGLLGPFIQMAEKWRKAIDSGQTAPQEDVR